MKSRGRCRAASALAVIGALCAAPLVGTPARASVEMIVDRGADAITVYLSMPAPEAVRVFGLPPSALVAADGTVPFDALRMGTFDIGDVLWDDVAVTLDGRPLGFEAMSLMVHPADAPVPFQTPLDALTAIGVCTVADPSAPLRLDQLHLYVGLTAYRPDAAQAGLDLRGGTLAFALPRAAGGTDITVRDFAPGMTVRSTGATWDPDRALILPPPAAGRGALFWAALAIAGVALAAALWYCRPAPGNGGNTPLDARPGRLS